MKTLFLEYMPVRLIIILFILSASRGISSAQPSPQEQKDNIDAQRIGFITKELELTSVEAQVFWPVYNKYRTDLEILRKGRATELMAARVSFEDYSDEEVNKVIENEFSYRQKELDLSRKYNEEFKKILPLKKVAKLYRAEQLFKIYLLKDIKQDKSGIGQSPQIKK
jgi:hypothetical protein